MSRRVELPRLDLLAAGGELDALAGVGVGELQRVSDAGGERPHADLPVGGWALAAALWAAVHVLDALLRRARGDAGNLAASGVQAFGLFFKSIGVLVVLVAAVVADPKLAVAAAVTYALAYTFELGLNLATYFGSTR